MVVHRKEGCTSPKVPDYPMLGFWDSEKIRGIPDKIFPLIIIAIVGQFNVSHILINSGNSYVIMYSDFFEKIG